MFLRAVILPWRRKRLVEVEGRRIDRLIVDDSR
jgi:hypothetical protein